MKKPFTLEPFQTVRMRRIRNERLRRLALGLAFGLVVFAIGGGFGL